MKHCILIKYCCLDEKSKTLKRGSIPTIILPKKSHEESKPSTSRRIIEKKELVPSKVYKDINDLKSKVSKLGLTGWSRKFDEITFSLDHWVYNMHCTILRPCLHETGTKSNRNENWKSTCLHETGTKITKFSICSSCQAIFFPRMLLLACVVPISRLQPRSVWNVFVFTFIIVWIHAGLKSVGLVQQAEWLQSFSVKSVFFSSRSHVNIYYK